MDETQIGVFQVEIGGTKYRQHVVENCDGCIAKDDADLCVELPHEMCQSAIVWVVAPDSIN